MENIKETSPAKPQSQIYQRDFDPKNDPRTQRVAPVGQPMHDLVEHYNSVANGTSHATNWALSYGVQFRPSKVTEDGTSAAMYEAWTPYRMVTYDGTTREEAIASLLFGVADLARQGAFNPHDAMAKGSPPLQHTMEILQERLNWHMAQRKDCIETTTTQNDENGQVMRADEVLMSTAGRHNEAIISLGTAIAALARVKDL